MLMEFSFCPLYLIYRLCLHTTLQFPRKYVDFPHCSCFPERSTAWFNPFSRFAKQRWKGKMCELIAMASTSKYFRSPIMLFLHSGRVAKNKWNNHLGAAQKGWSFSLEIGRVGPFLNVRRQRVAWIYISTSYVSKFLLLKVNTFLTVTVSGCATDTADCHVTSNRWGCSFESSSGHGPSFFHMQFGTFKEFMMARTLQDVTLLGLIVI
jgi:hypothetical protein